MVISNLDRASGREVYVNIQVPQAPGIVPEDEERLLPVCPMGCRRRCVAITAASFVIGVIVLTGYLVGPGGR